MRNMSWWLRSSSAFGLAVGSILANGSMVKADEPKSLPAIPAALPQTISTPTAASNQAGPGPAATTPLDSNAAQPQAQQVITEGQADGPNSIFAKVPPIPQVLPKPGVFFMPPQGPGYYSFRDFITDTYREKRPPQPYSPISPDIYPFFNANFFYLDNPNAEWQSPSDALKRMRFGDDLFMLSVGGEERIRAVNEVNSRLSGKNNNYDLLRTRVYGDLWYEDKIRVYVEYIDAQSFNQNLPPLGIDVNKSDLLNAFSDIRLFSLDGSPVYVRGGRQELCFGSQRLISPLDWANTRRTFEGLQLFRYSEKFDASFFWTQPVIINPVRFDSVDDKQNFSGAWFTYRPEKTQAIDLYYLNLDNDNHNVLGETAGKTRVKGSFNTSTFGARYAGNQENLLFDFEGMYEFGPWSNQDTSAAAYTTAVGWNFSKLPTTPQFWISWDFASGDHNPGTTDTHGTFNQLFPFGHYYFGYLDLVGRQNIQDLNFQTVFWPAKWVTCWAQYHLFRLDSAKDALYGAGGQVLRVDPTGRAGKDVGNELDLVTNFHLAQNQDVWVGWSKLYEGSFLKKTGLGPSPELFYVQYSFRW
jgi:hypothetical protein